MRYKGGYLNDKKHGKGTSLLTKAPSITTTRTNSPALSEMAFSTKQK